MGRSGYLCRPRPGLAAAPRATVFCLPDGGRLVAVVNLGRGGNIFPAVYVGDAAAARVLASAFSQAAGMVDRAAAEVTR